MATTIVIRHYTGDRLSGLTRWLLICKRLLIYATALAVFAARNCVACRGLTSQTTLCRPC